MKDGVAYYPATVIDANARQLSFSRLPVRVVSHVYGSRTRRSVLPPIPVMKPRFHRRALKRVRKSLRLLDRAYDALEAHLAELREMRKKVASKLTALQNEQIKHGYVLLPAPEPAGATAVVSPQIQALMRSYLLNALETENKPAGASAVEKDAHVHSHDIVSLIEEADHVEEHQEEEQEEGEEEEEQ